MPTTVSIRKNTKQLILMSVTKGYFKAGFLLGTSTIISQLDSKTKTICNDMNTLELRIFSRTGKHFSLPSIGAEFSLASITFLVFCRAYYLITEI